MNGAAGNDPRAGSAREVFRVFLKLGVSSFGGPIAHIGYFREEFVVRRRWLSEQTFVDLVALCQFLPGPASSQTGFAIGLIRAGYAGALAAWAGFTLPSAILMVLFAYGATTLSGPRSASSQTGFAIGLIRAGYAGALAAWAGFTLPSAILMVLFAYGATTLSGP